MKSTHSQIANVISIQYIVNEWLNIFFELTENTILRTYKFMATVFYYAPMNMIFNCAQ